MSSAIPNEGREFPFPIPCGWFRVGFVDECTPGDVDPIRYFGRDLVRVCTESGEFQVFDAFCPHLGAHLGHGGRVVGETLRCPFHAWRFGMDGRCEEVPYAKRIPRSARLRTIPTAVQNGIVWAWHHPRAEEPAWEAPVVPELSEDGWSPLMHHRWVIRTQNQEIAENTSDPAHFKAVHGFRDVPSPEITFSGHRSRSITAFAGRRSDGEVVESTLEVLWDGLGVGVTRATGVLDLLLVGTNTPVDETTIEACFSFSVSQSKGLDPKSGAGKAFIGEAIRQMEQDIPIWENKQFHERPALCDGDGPIVRFREWASQFYLVDVADAVDVRPS